MEIGEVLRIDDSVTGFDDNKRGRPCMVVRVEPEPRSGAWVVPRTTTGSSGTLTPGGLLPGLEDEGRFMYLPHRVSGEDSGEAPSLGVLPEPHLSKVLRNVNDVEINIDP